MADAGAVGINRSKISTHDAVYRLGGVRHAALSRYKAAAGYLTVVNRSNEYRGPVSLGTVANRSLRLVRTVPWWTNDARALIAIPVNGVISGVLEREGAALDGGTISLYYRATGALIRTKTVGPSGAFSFDNLDPGDYYFAVGFDTNVLPTAYNAKILDLLQPVAA